MRVRLTFISLALVRRAKYSRESSFSFSSALFLLHIEEMDADG